MCERIRAPAGVAGLGAGLGFALGLLRKTLLRGLHVLHFREHDFGGVLELKGGVLQLLGALRKTGLLVFHIFGLMNASKFDRAAFLPHGIPVAAPTCGRCVRGGGPNEDDTHAAKTRIRDTLQRSGVPLATMYFARGRQLRSINLPGPRLGTLVR